MSEISQNLEQIGFEPTTIASETPIQSLPRLPGHPGPVNRQIRSRKWFITVWDEDDLEKILKKRWKYIIVSALDDTHEHGAMRSIHRHIFAQDFSNNPRLATKNAHWEIPEHINACVDYCKNKGTPLIEEGNLGRNTRDTNDWGGFIQSCKTATRKELIDGPHSKLYAKHRGFAAEVQATYTHLQQIDGEMPHLWLWGPSGTGKSHYCRRNWPDAYLKMCNKWWDGYDNESSVLIEDIGKEQGKVLSHHLKIWADRYSFLAESKGFARKIRPQLILVTSNYSPDEIWEDMQEDLKAIKRRFNIVRVDHNHVVGEELLPIPFTRYEETH